MKSSNSSIGLDKIETLLLSLSLSLLSNGLRIKQFESASFLFLSFYNTCCVPFRCHENTRRDRRSSTMPPPSKPPDLLEQEIEHINQGISLTSRSLMDRTQRSKDSTNPSRRITSTSTNLHPAWETRPCLSKP